MPTSIGITKEISKQGIGSTAEEALVNFKK
jgi:hypothetical protein